MNFGCAVDQDFSINQPAIEHMTTSFSVFGDEMEMIARDIDPSHITRIPEPNYRALQITVISDFLLVDEDFVKLPMELFMGWHTAEH